jgi:galactonate dehydratase
MKITKLEVFRPRGLSILRIDTDEGPSGWGECLEITTPALERAETSLRGQDPTRYDVLTRQLAGDPVAAAVNMALLDIAGKAARVPVFQLLGGPTRHKVRALARIENPNDIEALSAQGHRAFLLPIKMPASITSRPRTAANIVAGFEALRKRWGDSFDFVPDGAHSLSSAEANDLAVAFEPLHPLWFNEPCRDANQDVLKRIASESSTPLGLGARFNDPSSAQDLLREGIVDVLRLAIRRLGITAIRRAAALAETYYVAVAPAHGHGGPIATAAALHLAASLPNFFIQEIPAAQRNTQTLRDELVGGPLEKVTAGYLTLSTKPGLGIEVNEQALRRIAQ